MSSSFPFSRRKFLKTASAVCALIVTRAKASQNAAILRAPYLQNLSATCATVMWTMAANVSAAVSLRGSAGYTQSVPATVALFNTATTGLSSNYYQYQAVFTGLTPGTTYSYQIENGLQTVPAVVPLMQFATPASDAPFEFLHFADSGVADSTQLGIAAQMAAENPALILANGDLAYTYGAFAEIEANFFSIYSAQMARIPFFTSLGNHEYMTGSGAPSLAGRAYPNCGVSSADSGRYYSFDWGNAHFVVLDTNDPLSDVAGGTGNMCNWLENDLAATDKFWRFVYFHAPPYATGVHQDEAPAGQVRQYVVPILEQYGVQAVFSGHEHTYQRTFPLLEGNVVDANSGILYFTSGGGGQDPYYTAPNSLIAQSVGVNNYLRCSVNGASLSVTAIALGGSYIDSLTLQPAPHIEGPAVNASVAGAGLASGGMLSIAGRNFSSEIFQSDFTSAVTSVAGVSVSLNAVPIPLLYAGGSQVNAQIPFGFTGNGTLQITTPNGSDTTEVTVAPVAPAIFENTSLPGIAMAMHADQSLITPDAPAAWGESITIVVAGLGAVTGNCNPGVAPQAQLPVVAPVAVSFGRAQVAAAATTSPTSPGTYFVQVQVPDAILVAAAVRGPMGCGTVPVCVVGGSSVSAALQMPVIG